MFKSILITPQKKKSPIICISVVCCCASTNNLLAPEDHFESSPEWSVRRHIPHNHSRLKEHFKLVVIACVRRKAKLVALWT